MFNLGNRKGLNQIQKQAQSISLVSISNLTQQVNTSELTYVRCIMDYNAIYY